MAARLAAPSQGVNAGGGASPGTAVRELIVIPATPNPLHLQHAIHQVSNNVGETVNGDSSGQSSPSADQQHHYITVSGEGGTGVNYHVQYVEPQEIYTQSHQTHMETLRTYPVYGVATVGGAGAEGGSAADGEGAWGGGAEFAAYGVVVAGDEAEAPASPATPATAPRTPPATVQWLLDNYETAEGVSLPRSTLYAHYIRHCSAHHLEPVNAASFGKLIRSVFIGLRTRRLGTRGNSKYHYYGIRSKAHAASVSPPRHQLDEAQLEDKPDLSSQQEARGERDSPDTASSANRQYLGTASPPETPELILPELPLGVAPASVAALRRHHRAHSAVFLEAVAALDTGAVERARRDFWRRPPPELPRKTLFRLAARRNVAGWLRRADLALHQRAVELLLPDVLKPIPPQLTQSIRNFAKSLEGALSAGSTGAPPLAARAQARAAAALAAALRRYTSLNHLAQAARAVLHNSHQIQQMLADLNRVDFRVVREQAAWACACPSSATAHRLEADFKATLGRGASLEQWACWLEGCVRTALTPHERKPDYAQRARRFLLDWSFYSSLVIRELTLRSAASFGSFHLIRLLYDEYVAYLVERRVATHEHAPPIAIMHRAQEDDEEGSEDAEVDDGIDGEDEDEWEWDDEDEEDDDKKIKLQ